jgi:hypothetical protein
MQMLMVADSSFPIVSNSTQLVLSTIGLSAIISAAASALINYLINVQQVKRKARADRIEDRVSVYVYFIFQLMEFTKNYFALGSSLGSQIYSLQKELEGRSTSDKSEMTRKIRQELSEKLQLFEKQNQTYEALNSVVNPKLYRFSWDVNDKWNDLKVRYRILNSFHLDRPDESAKEVEGEFRAKAFELFELLAKEYNNLVFPEYAKLFGKGSEYLVVNSVDPETLKHRL